MFIINLGKATGCLLSIVYFEGWGSLRLTDFVVTALGIKNCLVEILDCCCGVIEIAVSV